MCTEGSTEQNTVHQFKEETVDAIRKSWKTKDKHLKTKITFNYRLFNFSMLSSPTSFRAVFYSQINGRIRATETWDKVGGEGTDRLWMSTISWLTHTHTHTHTRHNRCHLPGSRAAVKPQGSEWGRSEAPLHTSVLLYDTCCRYLLSQTGLVPVSPIHTSHFPLQINLREWESMFLCLSRPFSLVACLSICLSLILFISPIHNFPSHPEGTQHGHNWPI